MSTAVGPDTLGENSITFMYDVGDTVNCFKGKPTLNLYAYLQFGFYQQEGNHSATRTTGPAPGLNLATNYDYHTVVATGNWQSEVNRLIIWTNTTLTANYTFNISFWARVTSAPTATIGCAFYGNALNQTMAITSEWKRFSIQSTTHPAYRATEFGSLSGAITFQIAGLQIEAQGYATPYANTTRSVTQALSPLIGTSALNLSYVSFDSNAQITFDGSDDYINTDFTSGPNGSIELIIKSGAYDGKIPISINSDGYSSGPNIYFSSGYILWNIGDSASNPFSNASYPNSNYHHLVVTNSSIGSATLYIDGVLIGTATGRDMTTTGANKLWIGRYHDGSYNFNGQLPVVRMYNIILSADQIKQNYNKYKSRFNLS